MRRKGMQTGSVRYKSGSWYVRFREWRMKDAQWVWGDTEKRIEDNGERLTKKRAELLGYEQWVSHANTLNKAPQGHMSVEFFVENYFQTVVAKYRKSWKKSCASLLRAHIVPAFGKLELNEVRPALVQNWIDRKAQEKSGQTVKHLKNVLFAVFAHARRLEFLKLANPAEDLILPEINAAIRPAWTMDQIRQLAAKLSVAGYAQYGRVVTLVSLTGMRIGECMGLIWENVDWEYKFVMVRSSWTAGERGKTKTEGSIRRVALTEEALGLLRTELEMTKWNGAKQPIFAGRTGRPLVASNVLKRFVKPAAIKLGMVDFDWHSERHTTATVLDRHATPSQKKSILGHTSQEMSERYTHPELEGMREVLEKATKIVN